MSADREILSGAVRQILRSGKTQMHREDVAALAAELQLERATFGDVADGLSSEAGQRVNYQGSEYGGKRATDSSAQSLFHFGIRKGPRVRLFGGANKTETEETE